MDYRIDEISRREEKNEEKGFQEVEEEVSDADTTGKTKRVEEVRMPYSPRVPTPVGGIHKMGDEKEQCEKGDCSSLSCDDSGKDSKLKWGNVLRHEVSENEGTTPRTSATVAHSNSVSKGEQNDRTATDGRRRGLTPGVRTRPLSHTPLTSASLNVSGVVSPRAPPSFSASQRSRTRTHTRVSTGAKSPMRSTAPGILNRRGGARTAIDGPFRASVRKNTENQPQFKDSEVKSTQPELHEASSDPVKDDDSKLRNWFSLENTEFLHLLNQSSPSEVHQIVREVDLLKDRIGSFVELVSRFRPSSSRTSHRSTDGKDSESRSRRRVEVEVSSVSTEIYIEPQLEEDSRGEEVSSGHKPSPEENDEGRNSEPVDIDLSNGEIGSCQITKSDEYSRNSTSPS